MWYYGVALEAVGTLMSTIGKLLFRYAAVTNIIWYYPLGAICAVLIYPIFDAVAYSQASQSIVTACAGLIVAWNVVLAPITLGERLTVSRLLSAFVICVGTVMVGLTGQHEEAPPRAAGEYVELFTRPTALAYFFGFSCYMGYTMYRLTMEDESGKGFYVASLGGSLAGNQFFTKAAMGMLACTFEPDCAADARDIASPYFAFFMVMTLTIHFVALFSLAAALRLDEALFIISVYEGFVITTGAISGNLVMNEAEGMAPVHVAAYLFSILTILGGLMLLHRWPSCLGQSDGHCSWMCILETLRGRRRRPSEGLEELEKTLPTETTHLKSSSSLPLTESTKLVDGSPV